MAGIHTGLSTGRVSPRRGPLALLLALFAFSAAGCGGDEGGSPLGPAVCAIEGELINPDGAVDGWVIATGNGSRLAARADGSGRYSLAVPPGRYRIEAQVADSGWTVADAFWTARGPTWNFQKAELVELSAGKPPLRADFRFGSVEVDVLPPESLRGRSIDCGLVPSDGTFIRYDRERVLANGHVRFRFPCVEPGGWKALCDISGAGRVYLRRPEESDTILVDPLSRTTLTAELPSPGWIGGRVRLACREEWSIDVTAFSSDSMVVAGSETDPGGAFEIPIWRPAQVRLMVAAGGISRWIGGETWDSATRFDAAPGTEIRGIEHTGSSIVCVLDPGIPEQLTGPDVRLLDDQGNDLFTRGTYYVQQADVLEFTNLAPGRYRLYVGWDFARTPWLARWFDSVTSSEQATPIVVEDGEISPVSFRLERGGTLSGRVLLPDGTPARYVRIWVHFESDHNEHSGGVTGSDGTFQVLGLEDGRYRIAAGLSGVPIVWYPGSTWMSDAAILTISHHTVIDSLEWEVREE